MKMIADYTQPLMDKCGTNLLYSHFLPILEKTLKKIERTAAIEEDVKNDQKIAVADVSDLEMMMLEDFGFISRDIYAFYPLLVRFIDKHKMEWITRKTPEAEELFLKVSEIFVNWAKSINFRREEQNYVVQNNIDNMAVITSDIVAHKVKYKLERQNIYKFIYYIYKHIYKISFFNQFYRQQKMRVFPSDSNTKIRSIASRKLRDIARSVST